LHAQGIESFLIYKKKQNKESPLAFFLSSTATVTSAQKTKKNGGEGFFKLKRGGHFISSHPSNHPVHPYSHPSFQTNDDNDAKI